MITGGAWSATPGELLAEVGHKLLGVGVLLGGQPGRRQLE
jgi:hypothetical protein